MKILKLFKIYAEILIAHFSSVFKKYLAAFFTKMSQKIYSRISVHKITQKCKIHDVHFQLNWNFFTVCYCQCCQNRQHVYSPYFLPIIQIGFLIKRSLPQKPMYFDRHPADQRRMTYSQPKKVTKQISIQKRVPFANVSYSLMVDKTLKIRHINTTINLKRKC